MVTKAVSDFFGKGGIADQAIRFNGFPFLDKEDHHFNEPVSYVMKRNVVAIPASGIRLDELEDKFINSSFRGFPVVQSRKDFTLLGYITRSDLKWGIEKARRSARHVSPHARCTFLKAAQAEAYTVPEEEDDDEYEDVGRDVVDFSPFVNEVRELFLKLHSKS